MDFSCLCHLPALLKSDFLLCSQPLALEQIVPYFLFVSKQIETTRRFRLLHLFGNKQEMRTNFPVQNMIQHQQVNCASVWLLLLR